MSGVAAARSSTIWDERLKNITDTFHDFEHAGWERASGHYGDAFGALTQQTAGALLNAIDASSRTRLLDVATRPGFIAAAAAIPDVDCEVVTEKNIAFATCSNTSHGRAISPMTARLVTLALWECREAAA